MPSKPSVPSALAGSLTSRNMSQIPTHAGQMAGAEVPTAITRMAGAETPTLLASQEPGISSLGRGVRAALGPGASAASDIFDASWRTIAGVGARVAGSPVGRALASVLGSRVGQLAMGPAGVAAMEAIPAHDLGDGSLGMSEMPQNMYSGSYDGPDSEPDQDSDDGSENMTPANWGSTDQIRAIPLPPSPEPGRDLSNLNTLGSVGEPSLRELGGGDQLAQALASAVSGSRSKPAVPQAQTPDMSDALIENAPSQYRMVQDRQEKLRERALGRPKDPRDRFMGFGM